MLTSINYRLCLAVIKKRNNDLVVEAVAMTNVILYYLKQNGWGKLTAVSQQGTAWVQRFFT
jgi:hypothetical protein